MANDGVSDDFNARIKRGDIDAFHTLFPDLNTAQIDERLAEIFGH